MKKLLYGFALSGLFSVGLFSADRADWAINGVWVSPLGRTVNLTVHAPLPSGADTEYKQEAFKTQNEEFARQIVDYFCHAMREELTEQLTHEGGDINRLTDFSRRIVSLAPDVYKLLDEGRNMDFEEDDEPDEIQEIKNSIGNALVESNIYQSDDINLPYAVNSAHRWLVETCAAVQDIYQQPTTRFDTTN